MKRKKFWIVFSIVLVCVVAINVFFALLFRIQKVDVEFRQRAEATSTNLPSNVQQKVLDSGNFPYGLSILFVSVNRNVATIEKDIPYVKVNQVIRYFPNRLGVYISERTPKFRVRDTYETDKWYILDEDFKVLDRVTTAELIDGSSHYNETTMFYYDKTFEVDPNYLTIEAQVGEFISKPEQMELLVKIADGIYAATTDVSRVKNVLIEEVDGEKHIELTMKTSASGNDTGGKILITGTDNIEVKVQAAVYTYVDKIWKSDDPSIDQTSIVFVVTVDANGKINVLQTEE
ncbi:MAG: FtsQ-type POTRA domain-containing protein [Clostridia bacterium]|nr:FtsQ-type POTRA domain-containing protein [Clostridia bacterium]